MTRALILIVLAFTALGCAGRTRGPIVDMKGVDHVQFRADVAECGTYAQQVAVGHQAAQGAVAGAVISGAVASILWKNTSAKDGAAAGAILGGARGAGAGLQERDRVVKTCLRNRGYAVLN